MPLRPAPPLGPLLARVKGLRTRGPRSRAGPALCRGPGQAGLFDDLPRHRSAIEVMDRGERSRPAGRAYMSGPQSERFGRCRRIRSSFALRDPIATPLVSPARPHHDIRPGGRSSARLRRRRWEFSGLRSAAMGSAAGRLLACGGFSRSPCKTRFSMVLMRSIALESALL